MVRSYSPGVYLASQRQTLQYLLWLLLCPYNFSIFVQSTIECYAIKSKGRNLFQSDQRNVAYATLFTLAEKFIVNLPTTENQGLESIHIGMD